MAQEKDGQAQTPQTTESDALEEAPEKQLGRVI
jgi:hypothetical protein